MIYVVQYPTGYDYNEIISYHYNLEDAENKAKEVNKNNPGIDCFVSEIEVE